MKVRDLARRFLIPPVITTFIYWLKFRCFVSPRAEVELSPLLRIGRRTRISSFSKIKANGPLEIGADVSIGANCFIGSGKGGVIIGDYTLIGPSVTISGDNYGYDQVDVPIRRQPYTSKGIVIGSDVWLGAGVSILDGVSIGKGCVIGSGAIVREDVPDYTVAIPHQKLMMIPRSKP